MTTPLEDLLLQMKSIGITDLASFPFPTPPPKQSFSAAVTSLTNIGAIHRVHRRKPQAAHMQWLMKDKGAIPHEEVITRIGKVLAKLSISPRLGKILVLAHRSGNNSLLKHVLSLTAVMAENSPFMLGAGAASNDDEDKDELDAGSDDDSAAALELQKKEKEAKKAAQLWAHPLGDAMARLRAFGAYAYMLSQATAAGDAAVAKVHQQDAALKAVREKQEQRREEAERASKKAKKSKNVNVAADANAKDKVSALREEATGAFSSLTSRRSLYAQVTAMTVEPFVKLHSLNVIVLNRSLELREQLVRQVQEVLGDMPDGDSGSGDDDSGRNVERASRNMYVATKMFIIHSAARQVGVIPPPSHNEEQALLQLMLTGYAENIARKVAVGVIKNGSRRMRLTAYQSCNPAVTTALYLHPSSSLFNSDPTAPIPEYVMYDTLLKNERGDCVYMTGISSISAAWTTAMLSTPILDERGLFCPQFPLMKLSAPLTSPSPYYDAAADEVLCYVTPRLGAARWELTPIVRGMKVCTDLALESGNAEDDATTKNVAVGFRKEDAHVSWFARALLEGKVPLFGVGSAGLFGAAKCRELPSVVTELRPIGRVTSLLGTLARDGIATRAALEHHMCCYSDGYYLCAELEAFLQVGHRKEFRKRWARMCRSRAE